MAANTFDIDELLKIYTASPDYRPQFEHRVNIVKSWNIPPGSHVLEIGPGQGDCTIVLATAVGESGHVDAVDPAPSTSGSPITIGQSQAQLSASSLGPRITWIEDSPEHHLSTIPASHKPYTHIVLFHSLWYFSSASNFHSLLRLLPHHTAPTASLCIAEYALTAPSLAAVPHVLAALTSATLETAEKKTDTNIRNIMTPGWMKESAVKEGWSVTEEKVLVPPEGLHDGRWEVLNVLSKDFAKDVEAVGERQVGLGGVLKGMKEAVAGALQVVEGGVKGVETMSVWTGMLERGPGL
ncbi:hypothetical protein BDR22DRAFT_824760 [Usnea florida]